MQERLWDAPVVVLTTSETTTSRMLAVLSYTSVSCGDVSAVLAGLGEMCRHCLERYEGMVSISSNLEVIHPSQARSIRPFQLFHATSFGSVDDWIYPGMQQTSSKTGLTLRVKNRP